MAARAISRLAIITAETVSIDGAGLSPTAASAPVERPAGDPQPVGHQADLALHDGRTPGLPASEATAWA